MSRTKQEEMPIEGPGVSPPRFKDLDRLADRFIETRDQKANLATQLGDLEKKIAEKMQEHGLTKYRFSDQEVVVKAGSVHIKIKTVKAKAADAGDNGDGIAD